MVKASLMAKKLKPRTLIVVLVVLFIVGYAYFRSESLILGPKIEIESPVNGETLENQLVKIEGRAARIATIFMNGRQIFTDQSGHFSEPLLLSYGYNIIKLTAQDKFGRSVSQTVELIFK